MDIRINVNFFSHPKTQKLIRRLGPESVLCLLQLWTWAAQNRPNGLLHGLDDEDLEIASGWSGSAGVFVDMLKSLAWLDETKEGLYIHDWSVHNPWICSSESRGDVARMSVVARSYPELYQIYQLQGKTAITREEYEIAVKDYLAQKTAGARVLSNDIESISTDNQSDIDSRADIESNDIDSAMESLSVAERSISPNTENQSKSQSLIDPELYTYEDISRITGVSEVLLRDYQRRYKDLDCLEQFNLIVDWVKKKRFNVKTWPAYIERWLSKVHKERSS